jgi:hypothetical protein
VRKKYYWCVHHKAWTLHSPQECRKSKENRKKRKNMKAHQRGRGHMIRKELLLKHWPCLHKAIQPHLAAAPTVLKTQIRTATSQELPTAAAAAAAQNHPHRVTRLLNMSLMSPDC